MKKLFSEIPYIKTKRLILRKIEETDAEGLSELAHSPNVYRFLPTFLFEQKYDDIHDVIRRLYDECFKESIILGVFMGDDFCGLAEIYGFREATHKASIGCRFLERYWGKGIATEAVGALVRYLTQETGIEIITASTMVANKTIPTWLKRTISCWWFPGQTKTGAMRSPRLPINGSGCCKN